jgi:O-antigen ligase
MNITNYNSKFLIFIKTIYGIFTIAIIFLTNKSKIEIKKLDFCLFVFLAYLLITIIWSKNQNFGLLKFFLTFLNFSFLWLLIKKFYVIKVTRSFNLFLKFWLLIISLFSIYIIIYNPVKFNTIGYDFRLFSHVFSGRLLTLANSSLLLTIVFKFNNLIKPIKYIYLTLFILILIAQINLAYRSGILAIFLVLLTLIFYIHKYEHQNFFIKEKFIRVILTILILLGVLIIILISNSNFVVRNNWLVDLIRGEQIQDVTVIARLDALKYSIILLGTSPILGAGFGSFNTSYFHSKIGLELKYPHNFFLEVLAETGLLGFIFIILILIKTIQNIILITNPKYKFSFLIFFIVFFVFAMFSKDLTFNIILLIFIYSNELYFNKKY